MSPIVVGSEANAAKTPKKFKKNYAAPSTTSSTFGLTGAKDSKALTVTVDWAESCLTYADLTYRVWQDADAARLRGHLVFTAAPPMNVLVACEQSGVVRDAFRAKGHNAWSCDILPSDSDYHFQLDLNEGWPDVLWRWDLIIAHPPCDHLAVSGARWFAEKRKDGRQQQGIDFFMRMVDAPADRVCVENPVSIMSTHYRKPDQIIQPWQFGHGETKATCLWLKGLAPLEPTNVVEGRENRIHRMPPSEDRAMLRSLTYTGIAQAMADQWASYDCQMDLEIHYLEDRDNLAVFACGALLDGYPIPMTDEATVWGTEIVRLELSHRMERQEAREQLIHEFGA